jgi:hypothetical protein
VSNGPYRTPIPRSDVQPGVHRRPLAQSSAGPVERRSFGPTVRIYGLPAEDVTEALSVRPSETQVENAGAGGNRPHGWFLCSEGNVASRDVRRHLAWCLEQLATHPAELAELRARGAVADVFCYWVSASGHGGPTISPLQAAMLADLQLECGFDIYFHAG